MQQMAEMQLKVDQLFDQKWEIDSLWHTLSIEAKLSVLLFKIHSRSNCRVGILTNLTITQLREYNAGDFIVSNEHKTGTLFMNFTYITASEKSELLALNEEWGEKKEGGAPEKVWPGYSEDKELTTQAADLSKAMKKLFNVDLPKYNPNNCRKTWDSSYYRNKDIIPPHLRRLFESNTGHSAKTAENYYTLPPTTEELKELFSAQQMLLKSYQKTAAPEAPEDPPSEEDPEVSEEEPQEEARSASPSTVSNTSRFAPIPEPEEMPGPSKTAPPPETEPETEPETSQEEDQDDADFVPPRKTATRAAQPQHSSRSSRLNTKAKFDELQKRLLKPPRAKPYKYELMRVSRMIAGERVKLNKSSLKDLIRTLNLPLKDEQAVLEKMYPKLMNLYIVLDI